MDKRAMSLLLIGIVGVCVLGSQFAIHLYRAYGGRKDIWWTPREMALSLEESTDDFRLLVDGEPLQDRMADKKLLIETGGKTRTLTAEDIRVRLNNWQRTRARFLLSATVTGVMLGAALTCLALGVILALRKPDKKANQPEDGPSPA